MTDSPPVLFATGDRQKLLVDLGLFTASFFPRFSAKWDLKRGACIAAACVTADVFRRLGYQAKPLSVILSAINPSLVTRAKAGEDVGPVQLTIGDPQDEERDGHWRGHLACLLVDPGDPSGGFILDASLQQAERPYLPGLPKIAALPFSPHPGDTYLLKKNIFVAGCARGQGDLEVSYYLSVGEGANGWKRAPDADPVRRRTTVARIVEQIQKHRESIRRRGVTPEMEAALSAALPGDRWHVAQPARQDNCGHHTVGVGPPG